MGTNPHVRRVGAAGLLLTFAMVVPSVAPYTPTLAQASIQKDTGMIHVRGEFDVNLSRQSDEDSFAMGRMTIDKTFRGDLAGTSKGQMLAFLNAAGDSGGYVAIERVTGTLSGKKGSFALQHSSTMDRGAQHQNVIVVPGSGTDELSGLIGSMVIDIRDRKHFYDFAYSLGDPK